MMDKNRFNKIFRVGLGSVMAASVIVGSSYIHVYNVYAASTVSAETGSSASSDVVSAEKLVAAETSGTSGKSAVPTTVRGYKNGEEVKLDSSWKNADKAKITSGSAIMYISTASNRKNKVVGVNAGHGTKGGEKVKTLCHPDGTPKVTGGTTAAGKTTAAAASSGMTFKDKTPERDVNLAEAKLLKDKLLAAGYDVLMIRDGEDVQLDNVARTVICNNVADCHIAIHWDSDGTSSDKGCFYMSVPDGIKNLDTVASIWKEDERLGESLISGLRKNGQKIFGNGNMDMDLTQTSYSTVPSVDIELGNQCSDHSQTKLNSLADGLLDGVETFFRN